MTYQQEVTHATVNLNSTTVKRRLDLLHPLDEDEVSDETEIPVRRV